ncbi:MAG: pilus assembly protein PilM [Raoultibacter sp.]
MGKTYTGIEINLGTLKMVQCDGNSIKSIFLEPLSDGLMSDGRITSYEAMGDLIKATARRHGGQAKQVAFVIPYADGLTRRIQMPAMSAHDLEINLPYEFRDYITQGKDKYCYDYALLETQMLPDGTPESFDLLAVAVEKQTIEDYERMFSRAGFKLAKAMPTSAALQNLIRNNQNAQANCCIIDYSSETTALHFFTNAAYDVTRTIEIGMVDVDNALADAYGVDAHMANSYRTTNYQDSQTCEAARSVYASIAVEVGRALNFYSFNNPSTSIDTSYYCGIGSTVDPLIKTVSSHVEVRHRSISEIMLPANDEFALLRSQCPAAVGATMG